MATEEYTQYTFNHPFYPGESCEDIYNMNPESLDKSGYYWILNGPRKAYCGMTYTGSSCEDMYYNNPETADKSGYYRINNTQWTFCNMAEISSLIPPTCAGVGGGWRRIGNIDISTGDDCSSGWHRDTHISSALILCFPLFITNYEGKNFSDIFSTSIALYIYTIVTNISLLSYPSSKCFGMSTKTIQ